MKESKISIVSDKLGKVDLNLYETLYISDDSNLTEQLSAQAAMLGYWGMVLHVAEEELNEVERKYGVWYSEVYSKHENRLWGEHDYKISFKPNTVSVENRIKTLNRGEWQLWRSKLDTVKNNVKTLERVQMWLKEKSQMLIQLSKIRLAEMESIDYELTRSRLKDRLKGESS